MKSALAAALAVLCLHQVSIRAGEPRLAALFTDHMILQRSAPVPVWGWADPGEEVTVEFAGQRKTTRARVDGAWRVTLDPLEASAEPRPFHAGGRLIRDVVVGDVWLCSGQSNMGMAVRDAVQGDREVADANYEGLRLFSVAQNAALEPVNDVKGQWEVCSPRTVERFSAAAYFFGRELHRDLNIPMGLLHSSVGGTSAEAWTRLEALTTRAALGRRATEEREQIQTQEADNQRFPAERTAWEARHGVSPPPIPDATRGWAAPGLDTSDWTPITLPARWAQFGMKSGGVFWVRKQVMLPESAANRPFSLGLNWVSEQYDTAFFNGVEIGHASDKAPTFYNAQRSYPVPGNLVKAGLNVIAVRIVSATQHAGLWQWGNALGLPVAVRGSVDDQWLMKTERVFAPLPQDALATRPKPNSVAFRNVSSALYNGMIAPLQPFAIRGAVWYQGESNVPRAREYRDLLALLINDWRAQWGQGDFPFIIQQLVNNGAPAKDPNRTGGWSFLREAQMHVATTVANAEIAVGIDLGDPLTIHPGNKQDVGKRLAWVALEKVYGKPIESSGPRFDSLTVEGAQIRVRFSHAAGLTASAEGLRDFAVAGADGKFVWAEARIEGETVVVSSPSVPEPKSVRYAWADNSRGAALYNRAGLPAAPFRSDWEP